jgi:hypothetical protein
MQLDGIRHLIECHCVLPQFKSRTPVVYHKFIVFSVVNDDHVQPKLAQCNNCGIMHRVVDICKSEIVHGLEEGSALRTIDDIKMNIPQRLSDFLLTQKLDLPTWEYIEFILDNKLDRPIMISKTDTGTISQMKILHITSDGSFKIKNETRQDDLQ